MRIPEYLVNQTAPLSVPTQQSDKSLFLRLRVKSRTKPASHGSTQSAPSTQAVLIDKDTHAHLHMTHKAVNRAIKQIRTNKGLDFAERLDLKSEEIVSILETAACKKTHFKYFSLYGLSDFSDQHITDIVKSFHAEGHSKLKTVFLPEVLLNRFTKIQNDLYAEISIQKISFQQDPREILRDDVRQQLGMTTLWLQLIPLGNNTYAEAQLPVSLSALKTMSRTIETDYPGLKIFRAIGSDVYVSTLNQAIKANNLECLEILFSNGIHVDAPITPDGKTALFEAAIQDKIDIVKQLLDLGANTKAKDNKHQKLLEIHRDTIQNPLILELLENTVS